MKGTYLGEFEELVLLTVGVLYQSAYGVSIKEEIEHRSGRKVTLSTVHSSLNRLEEKGYLESELGAATKERGGKRKRMFKITNLGTKALETSRSLREQLWENIPKVALENKFAGLLSFQ